MVGPQRPTKRDGYERASRENTEFGSRLREERQQSKPCPDLARVGVSVMQRDEKEARWRVRGK
jgi:hypothetical protein